uniref:Waprin-like protein n=1 Tax=Pantherophis guttatus TaxID=94885 RepID=A0A098LYI0_PANGU
MSSGSLLLLLGFLTLWAELTPVSSQDRPTKPGLCPPGPPKPLCVVKCENDWKCPGQQKCCRYGCLHECKDPIFVK